MVRPLEVWRHPRFAAPPSAYVLKSIAVDHLDRPIGRVRNKHESAGLIYVPMVEAALTNVTGKQDFAPRPKAH